MSCLREDLIRGRRELGTRFRSAPSRALNAGQPLSAAARPRDILYRLQAGWACKQRVLPDGRRSIVDIYLPGDIIGLDQVFHPRPAENVFTLTSIEVAAIGAPNGMCELIGSPPCALYITYLLGQRQRRADRLLTAVACLDARGRLATMLLDFHKRLRAHKLINGAVYTLPLTQQQIGSYLGLTIVHVNRVLKSLRDDRVVSMERHCVTIFDLERLTKLAIDLSSDGNASSLGEGDDRHEGEASPLSGATEAPSAADEGEAARLTFVA